MPRDAKLGLVAGVGLVIAIAVLFYRKDPTLAFSQTGNEAAIVPTSPLAASPEVPVTAAPAVTGTTAPAAPAASRPEWSSTTAHTQSYASPVRRHKVVEGDTLTGLARKYYGAEQQTLRIVQANRRLVDASRKLTPGTELVIPEEAGANQ